MKKLLYLVFITLLLSGCGKETVNKQEKKDNINDIEGYTYIATIDCQILEKEIKYMLKGIIITNDNEVYAYNVDKKYSNGTNCAKFEESIENIIIDGDKFYENNSQITFKLEDLSLIRSDNDLTIKRIEPLRGEKYYMVMQGPTKEGYSNTLYGIKNNSNIIYKFQIGVGTRKENGFNRTYYIIEKEEPDYEVSEEEIIINFSYNRKEEDFIKDFILTNKNYYAKRITNIKECTEIVDIRCNYEWYKDEVLSKIMDKLVYVYEDEIITKEGKIYHKNY